jgi:hypothetical protein
VTQIMARTTTQNKNGQATVATTRWTSRCNTGRTAVVRQARTVTIKTVRAQMFVVRRTTRRTVVRMAIEGIN